MSSSDEAGSGKNSNTARGMVTPADADAGPVEISVRGRIVIRSSSHPPGAEAGEGAVDDPSGVQVRHGIQFTGAPGDRVETFESRAKKITPAEKPRRRRQVQAALHAVDIVSSTAETQSSPLTNRESGVEWVGDVEPRPSAAELPVTAVVGSKRLKRLGLGSAIAVACAAVAIAWALWGR